MTVGELIAELRDFPEYLPVLLSGNGLGFWSVGGVEYLGPDEAHVALIAPHQED